MGKHPRIAPSKFDHGVKVRRNSVHSNANLPSKESRLFGHFIGLGIEGGSLVILFPLLAKRRDEIYQWKILGGSIQPRLTDLNRLATLTQPSVKKTGKSDRRIWNVSPDADELLQLGNCGFIFEVSDKELHERKPNPPISLFKSDGSPIAQRRLFKHFLHGVRIGHRGELQLERIRTKQWRFRLSVRHRRRGIGKRNRLFDLLDSALTITERLPHLSCLGERKPPKNNLLTVVR